MKNKYLPIVKGLCAIMWELTTAPPSGGIRKLLTLSENYLWKMAKKKKKIVNYESVEPSRFSMKWRKT